MPRCAGRACTAWVGVSSSSRRGGIRPRGPRAPAHRAGPGRAGHGVARPSADACDPPLGPGVPVHLRRLRAAVSRGGRPAVDGLGAGRLRQCAMRKPRFATLECELLDRECLPTPAAVRLAVFSTSRAGTTHGAGIRRSPIGCPSRTNLGTCSERDPESRSPLYGTGATPTGVGPSGLVASHGPPVDSRASGRRESHEPSRRHRSVLPRRTAGGGRAGPRPRVPGAARRRSAEHLPPTVDAGAARRACRDAPQQGRPTADGGPPEGARQAAGRGHPRHPGHGRRARPDERQRAPDSVVAA